MSRPQVLLIDEMSLGLAPVRVDQLLEINKKINATGVAILKQRARRRKPQPISSRAYVLEAGRFILAGPSNALLDDPKVRQAYLGV